MNNYHNNCFKVQIRTWPCGSYNPCACAVIAREGNDVIEIDMCEKRKDVVEAPTVSYPSGHPLEGTTVSRNETGKIFYVRFFKRDILTILSKFYFYCIQCLHCKKQNKSTNMILDFFVVFWCFF